MAGGERRLRGTLPPWFCALFANTGSLEWKRESRVQRLGQATWFPGFLFFPFPLAQGEGK